MGLVSIATTRPHCGQRNAAASVPSPGSCRSSKVICRSQSTHKNFIPMRNAECGIGSVSYRVPDGLSELLPDVGGRVPGHAGQQRDRKSTRLNSSHSQISYAVFCLKKKKKSTTVHYNAVETQFQR